jgi:hypothetical protein
MNREALLGESGINFKLADTNLDQSTQHEIDSATPQLFTSENGNFEGSKKMNFKHCGGSKDMNLELPNIVFKTQAEINEETDGYKNEIIAKLSILSPVKPMNPSEPIEGLSLVGEIVVVDDNSDSEVNQIANLSMEEQEETSYTKQNNSFDMSVENIDQSHKLSPQPTFSPIQPPSTPFDPKESSTVGNASIHLTTPIYRDIVYTPKQAPSKTILQPRKILVDNKRTSILANNKTQSMATEEKKVKFTDHIGNSRESTISQPEENNENKKVFKKPTKSSIIVRKIVIASKPILRVPENK